MALQPAHDVTVSMHRRWVPAHFTVHQLPSLQVQQPKVRMYISIDSGYYNQSMQALSGLHQAQSTDGTVCGELIAHACHDICLLRCLLGPLRLGGCLGIVYRCMSKQVGSVR